MSAGAELPLASGLRSWRELESSERRGWWEQLWLDAIALGERYRLALRTGWWEDEIAVEALQAFAAWVALYDTEGYGDPPGKLALLWEIDRLRQALRSGERAFDPSRDRRAYERHLQRIGCQTPGRARATADEHDERLAVARRASAAELAATLERLGELRERERGLQAALPSQRNGRRAGGASHAQKDLEQAQATIAALERRRADLERQAAHTRPGS